MKARRWWIGVAAVGVYLVAVGATLAVSGHRVLPLFESIGPPAPYRWVHPPPAFAAGNVAPVPAIATIPLAGSQSGAAVIETPDAQFVVNLSPGAIAPHPGDQAVHAMVTPGDPATLASVPAGLAADGNAYRIDLAYLSTGTPVSTLAVAGNVILTAPHRAAALLFSPDGRGWERLASTPVGSPTVIGASFAHPGWYLAATLPSNATTSTGASHTLAIAVGAAAGALVLGAAAVLVQRRRRS